MFAFFAHGAGFLDQEQRTFCSPKLGGTSNSHWDVICARSMTTELEDSSDMIVLGLRDERWLSGENSLGRERISDWVRFSVIFE